MRQMVLQHNPTLFDSMSHRTAAHIAAHGGWLHQILISDIYLFFFFENFDVHLYQNKSLMH